MSLDLLSKLNIKSLSYAPVASRNSLFDKDDVIWAIANLPPLVTTYIYAVNESASNDRKVLPNLAKLQVHFATKLFTQIRKDEFNTRKVSQIALADGIARAAIHTHFYVRGSCKKCNGLGILCAQTCGDCFGKGIKYISDVDKLKIAFPDVKFDRSWWGKYAKDYALIVEDELNQLLLTVDEALHQMKKELHKQAVND